MSQISTAVGFRVRGIAPADLSIYPDSAKLVFWGFVLQSALKVKDKELARGWDKDGIVHPLAPATIKHRKSEVGPTSKHAPRLTPSYSRSRVRSLLRGRAHTSSAELFWGFDSVTGASFARILHFSAEAGHDVFGITPAGLATVTREAFAAWDAWKARGGAVVTPGERPRAPVKVLVDYEIKRPIRKIPVVGRIDLENMTLAGDEDLIRRAIAAGQFTGFRRLNARGEKWKPGSGVGPLFTPTPKPPPAQPAIARTAAPALKRAPVVSPQTTPIVPPRPASGLSFTVEVFGRKALAAARLVPASQHYLEGKVWIVDAWEQFKRAYPDVTLDEFKDMLWKAHQAGAIQLSRADMAGSFGPTSIAKDRASNIVVGAYASFQVIKV